MTALAVIDVGARLPMPEHLQASGMKPGTWKVLTDTIFPMAKDPASIAAVYEYCKVRQLDPFSGVVHIVPAWSAAERRERESIWPGIALAQITASRTGQWAGMDEPVYGPMITRTFRGQRKIDGSFRTEEVTLTIPEWCSVTVYRLVGGQPRPFTEKVFWEEAYATVGGKSSELPNDMWRRRVRSQLAKCAKAAALRAAFPEESSGPTAEEMEGQVIDVGGITIDHDPTPPPPPKPAKPHRPPLMVNVPDSEPVAFPRSKTGIEQALDLIWEDPSSLVLLNLELLDNVAGMADFAERVSQIRAAAMIALTPTESEEWPGVDAGAEQPQPADA